MSSHRTLKTSLLLAGTIVFAASASAQGSAPPVAAPAAAPAAVPAPPPPAEIDIGRIAPDFTIRLADSAGIREKPAKLSDLRGKVVVLAFYPADRSSGCTAELTKFRDEYLQLFGSGTVVVPISGDSLESHASWAQEMRFPFALGADTDLAVAKQYGSWNSARNYATRTIFVIGRNGRILWRNLKFPALNESAYTELAAEVAKAQ
jgi:peroxiredoxin Q/BCP